MNCAKHTEVAAAAFCRTCGRALCESCKRDVHGAIYCEDCLASRVQGAGAAAVPGARPGGPNPVLAGLLSAAPFGVAQAYMGQYARGVVYLLVFIALVWGADRGGPFETAFGLGIAAFIFFQFFDAIRSARHLQMGLPAPDPFGIDNLFGPGGKPTPAEAAPAASVAAATSGTDQGAPVPSGNGNTGASHVPTGAIVLIAIGVLFLLGNMGIIHFWMDRLWPLILIAIGGWLLVSRWDEIASGSPQGRRKLMPPAVLLALGGMFLIDSLGRLPFDRTWPLLLIVIGLVLFWQRTAPPPARPPMPPAPPAGPGAGPQIPQLGPGEIIQTDSEQQRRY
jgi:hypothetical protein